MRSLWLGISYAPSQIIQRGASHPPVVRVDKHAPACQFDTRGVLGQNGSSKAHVASLRGSKAPMPLGDRSLPVQQRCSNPSKSSEILGKASFKKHAHLQVFCNHQKASANYLTAFARRRAGVRIPSAPPLDTCVLRDKPRNKDERPVAGGALVQRLCSNAKGEPAKA